MKHLKSYENFLNESKRESIEGAIKTASIKAKWAARTFLLPVRLRAPALAVDMVARAIINEFKQAKEISTVRDMLSAEEDPAKRARLRKKLENMTLKEIVLQKKIEDAKKKMEAEKDKLSIEDQKLVKKEISRLRKEKRESTKGWRKYIYPVWKL